MPHPSLLSDDRIYCPSINKFRSGLLTKTSRPRSDQSYSPGQLCAASRVPTPPGTDKRIALIFAAFPPFIRRRYLFRTIKLKLLPSLRERTERNVSSTSKELLYIYTEKN